MEKPFEIVVLSGKGGTGKTSIMAAFASMAENAVFADCDVDAADLHLLFSPEIYKTEKFISGSKAKIDPQKCTACSICYDLCRFHAIDADNEVYKINEYNCEGCGLCIVACPEEAITIEHYENNHIYFCNTRFGEMVYGKLGIAEENSGKLVAKIRQYIREKARKNKADYILTDGPPGIGCPAISSVSGADMVIAVTEPTLSGWHDLQRLLQMIRKFGTAVYVIINKYDLNEEMSKVIETKLQNEEICVLGKIPYDDTMIFAMLNAKTINEFKADHHVSIELKNIWKKINTYIYESKIN